MAFDFPGKRPEGFVYDMVSRDSVVPVDAETEDADRTLEDGDATRTALRRAAGERAVDTVIQNDAVKSVRSEVLKDGQYYPKELF